MLFRDAPRGLENPSQPAVALSQSAADDLLARCDRTGRVQSEACSVTPAASTPISGRTRCVTSFATHMLQRGVDIPDHPDLARPFEPCDPRRDLHPPDRAAAGPAPHAAVPDHRRPLRGKEAQPWLIPRSPAKGWPSSWRTSYRRFGPQYTSQYGHRMMPSQKKALSDIAACCTPELAGTALNRLRRLPLTRSGTTTAAGTGHAPNATNPGPAVARRASSRAVMPAFADFHAVVTVPSKSARNVPYATEVAVRHA